MRYQLDAEVCAALLEARRFDGSALVESADKFSGFPHGADGLCPHIHIVELLPAQLSAHHLAVVTDVVAADDAALGDCCGIDLRWPCDRHAVSLQLFLRQLVDLGGFRAGI